MDFLVKWLCLLLIVTHLYLAHAKKKIHIPDDLDDVIDNEEDESWIKWGKPEEKNVLKNEESNKDFLSSLTKGPGFSFVKLRYDPKRPQEDLKNLAWKWSNMLKSNAIHVKFYPVDLNTLYAGLADQRSTLEVKEFILDQPEAYEVKIGNEVFRRPGDPPLEDVARAHAEDFHRTEL